MDYGVNANGMPTTGTGGSGGVTCPSGYVWNNQEQSCQPKITAGRQTGAPQPQTQDPGVSYHPNPSQPSSQNTGITNYGNPQVGSSTANTAPFDINEWGQRWIKSGGKTNQDFANFVKANPLGAGYSLSGSKQDKVVGPGGNGWDMVYASGLGGQGATFNAFGGSGSGSGPSAYLASTGTPQHFPFSSPAPNPYQPGVYANDPTKKSMGDLIMKMLTSTSMSPEVVAQMKEQQKDSLLSMMEQARQGAIGSAASRGVSGGGSTAAALQDIMMKGAGDISSAYRDIDVKKVAQDRLDNENAVGAARNYNNDLFQEYLGGEGLKRGSSQDAFYNWLSQQGINLDWLKYLNNNSLDVARFLSGQ